MSEQDYEVLLEECRVKFNESAKLLGTAQMGRAAFREAIENPAVDPRVAWTRMEDKERPDRVCAWCFHPRNSPECDFAAKHTPYREMFA